LTTLLQVLHTDANFEHVDALANKAKHSSIVRPMLNEDFTGVRTNRLELQFAGFSRKGKFYPQISIANVLSPAYAKASQTLVDVGNELKRLLT
jgi:hypothetical protein